MKKFRHGNIRLISFGRCRRSGVAAGRIERNWFHHHPRLKFLQTFDDHAFPGLQPIRDDPFISHSLADLISLASALPSRAHHHRDGDTVRAER